MTSLVTFLAILTLFLGAIFTIGWLVMLSLGALGHIFGVDALFISFWNSVIVALVLSFIGSFFSK